MDNVSLLWPWDAPPPSLPDLTVVAGGAGALPARLRELRRRAAGSFLVLPARGSVSGAREALALLEPRPRHPLVAALPTSFTGGQAIAGEPAAWDAVAGVLGEHEPHALLPLLGEAARHGIVVELRRTALHEPPQGLSADTLPSVRSFFRALLELAEPLRGRCLALALAELLAPAARIASSLAPRFAFGREVVPMGLLDLGDEALLAWLCADDVARRIGPPPRQARLPELALPEGASAAELVPRGQLPADARAALEELLDLGRVTLPEPPPEPGGRPGMPPSEGEGLLPRRVSIVIPTLDAADMLGECLESLRRNVPSTLAPQIVVVDNGSKDATAEVVGRFKARHLPLAGNQGFAAPCNRGAAESWGDVIVFLNNDAQVEPGWLEALLAAIDGGAAAASSLVLSHGGGEVDFGGGGASFEGKGFQDGHGDRNVAAWSEKRRLLFGNGASLAVRRDAWERAGGFDAAFFAYYEDVDLGIRMNLAGDEVVLAPDSRVRHRHNATSRLFPQAQKTFHMERNALRTVAKIYGPDAMGRILPAALLMMVHRGVVRSRLAGAELMGPLGLDRGRLEELRGGDLHRSVGWTELALHVAAMGQVLAELPEILPLRRAVQAGRKIDDGELVARMGHFLDAAPTPEREAYRRTQEQVLAALGVPRLLADRTRRRVAFVTHEELGPNLAGPAIRVVELAKVLAARHDVAIATPKAGLAVEGVRVAEYDRWEEATLLDAVGDAEVLVLQGHTTRRYRALRRHPAAVVCDLYCPFPLENLEVRASAPAEKTMGDFEGDLEALEAKLVRGDYFLAASEKQKDLWLGALLAAGRINPLTYGDDPELARLVGVVPFGIPSHPPVRQERVKGRRPGIAATDRLLLWGGSIVDWQDPLTVIRAVAHVVARRPDVKLLFMGVAHPTPGVVAMSMVARARELARSLGLLDTHVFFEGWVPYERRADHLLDADVAVLAHPLHVETRFSFRTRVLDCIWASLPLVVTRGDTFAELCEARGLGLVVEPGDPDAFARALLRILEDDALRASCAARLAELQPEFTWEAVAAPLLARLPALHAAPDRLYVAQRGWRRMLLRYGGGELLDTARRVIPKPVRRTLKSIFRMGR